MKTLIFLVLLASFLAPTAMAQTSAHANPEELHKPSPTDIAHLTPEEQRRSIQAWLSHYHELPSRADLERISPNARSIVFEIARDEDAFLFHRQRALRALTHWPDQEVFTYLQNLLHHESTEDGLRHNLLPILATGFGVDALPDLRVFLFQAEDPQIRISAAAAINQIPGDLTHRLLLEALESERNPLVRNRLREFSIRIQ